MTSGVSTIQVENITHHHLSYLKPDGFLTTTSHVTIFPCVRPCSGSATCMSAFRRQKQQIRFDPVTCTICTVRDDATIKDEKMKNAASERSALRGRSSCGSSATNKQGHKFYWLRSALCQQINLSPFCSPCFHLLRSPSCPVYPPERRRRPRSEPAAAAEDTRVDSSSLSDGSQLATQIIKANRTH